MQSISVYQVNWRPGTVPAPSTFTYRRFLAPRIHPLTHVHYSLTHSAPQRPPIFRPWPRDHVNISPTPHRTLSLQPDPRTRHLGFLPYRTLPPPPPRMARCIPRSAPLNLRILPAHPRCSTRCPPWASCTWTRCTPHRNSRPSCRPPTRAARCSRGGPARCR